MLPQTLTADFPLILFFIIHCLVMIPTHNHHRILIFPQSSKALISSNDDQMFIGNKIASKMCYNHFRKSRITELEH